MKISNELKIGILVVGVLGMLVYLTFRTGEINFSKEGYTIRVEFQNVDGVAIKSPVMLNGLEVGWVENINIKDNPEKTSMELVLWVDKSARIHKGTQAYIKNMGFLGEKYVNLVSGKEMGYVSANEMIAAREPVDMDSLLLDGKDIVTQVKELTTNLNERLRVNEEKIDNIVLNLDSSMVSLKSITANVDERLTVNKTRIDNIFGNMESSSVNLDQFTYDLKLHPWKLLYRSKEEREKSIDMLDKK